MEQATKEMRCIDWSKMDRQLFVSSPREQTSNRNALYDLSRPVAEHDKIDFFISHSWSDQGHAKFKALSAIASAFRKERGREPTFWFDKVNAIIRCLSGVALFCFLAYVINFASFTLSGLFQSKRDFKLIEGSAYQRNAV